MMKEILVGISADQEGELRKLAQRTRRSRSALIRDAIDRLLAEQRRDGSSEAFGLWGAGEDGLAYQRRLREEW